MQGKKDLRGFKDNESGLCFIALDDLENFIKEDVLTLIKNEDAIRMSNIFLNFIKEARQHFSNQSMDA